MNKVSKKMLFFQVNDVTVKIGLVILGAWTN
jgi:hypothetical protein